MALTRLDNLISSKTGKYLYVSPDDFNASDELNNRGNSPIRPFKSIQRGFLEIARYSYLPGPDNDRFDQFTIMLMPGNHYIDNRPGLVDTNGIDAFSFNQALNEWEDNSNLDISDPNNKLYLFNNTEGGAILPRGSSLVGYDLRRTVVRPLYVPDPADRLEKRSAIFNVTGACYFWQFTIKDGDLEPSSPLYDKNEGVGKVYYQNGYWDQLAVPNYSHHKLTVFEYADKEELGLYYRKIAKAFSAYQPTIDDPGEFTERIQETRIVGPLSDIRSIESIKCTDSSPAGTITVEITTKVDHGYFKNQFIAIEGNGLDEQLNGTFPVSVIDLVDSRKFQYQIAGTVAALGTTAGLVSGTTYTSQNGLSANAVVKAEVDSVESASPYVFNCSIRSTWGICGIWADGLKATGFKSMVIAQYTGVSLQKDDRAFIRYDEYTNTWNQASLTDAFATVPYHTKGDAYWKDDWRNFHVRASDDAFIQNVSIFAVGFADHFLMESGGDMSITNSNSNFGNTSLHAIGFKGFAFNQDKGGYITDIVPPQIVPETTGNTKKNAYYTIDVKASNDPNNHNKLYLGNDDGYDPADRPAASIDGFRVGARTDEKLYVKLTPRSAGSDNIFNATLTPNGFKKFTATADILNPGNISINNKDLDAANRIEENKNFIAHEAYGYITGKYPSITIKENITIEKCRRDIGYLIDATIQDLRLGGNINTIQAAESYYVGNNLSYITGELTETLEGYNYARDLAIAAMRNFSYLRKGGASTAGAALVDVGNTSGIVQGMLIADYDPSEFTNGKLNENATRPASPVIPDGTYVKNIVNSSFIEIGQKAVFSEKKLVSDRYGDAKDQILTNKNFIAAEAVARMHLDFPGFSVAGGDQNCIDDVVDVLEAVAENTAFGGNAETWDAAYLYETGNHIVGEEQESLRVFKYARDMAIQVQRNEDVFVFGTHGLTQTKDITITYEEPEVVTDRHGDAHDLILVNQDIIAEEAVARMMVAYPAHTYGSGYTSADCVDDVRDLLLAIADNVAYGGNDKTWDAAYSYVKGAHVVGEEAETNYAFEQAKEMAAQVMRNQKILAIGSHGLTQTYSNYAHTFVSATTGAISSGGNYAHTFVSAVVNGVTSNSGNLPNAVTDVAYTATTGDMTITSTGHGLTTSNTISIVDNALTFTCAMDGNTATKTYPRSTDPVSGQNIAITATTTDTFTINVGASPIVSFAPTNATYDAATGLMVLTIGAHTLTAGTSIKIAANSLTFTCSQDGNASQHTYPRSGDPAYDTAVNISAVTANTITVNVGIANSGFANITYDLPDPVIDRNGDARNLIISNKALIAAEAYERMMAENPGYVHPTGYGPQDCIDDILDFVNEVSYNLAFGGNDRVWDMANLYVVGQHVVGEELQTTQAFEYARDLMVQAMRNEVILSVGSHGLTQTFDNTITYNLPAPVDNKSGDAKNLILANKDFIAEVAFGRMQVQYPTFAVPTGNNVDCIDDIKDIIEVVSHNLAFGGNDRVWDAANLYATGQHVAGEEAQTLYAFAQARDIMVEVIRNEDVTVDGHTSLTQSKDLTITADTANPTCASQASTIASLVQLLTNTISAGNTLYNVTRTVSLGSCNDVRDALTTLTNIVTTAVTTPASLSGVTRSVSVGSCEDVRSTINTLFTIVQNAVITPSTLSNIGRTISNGSCQNVTSAITTLFKILTDTIDNPGYLESIDRQESPLGLAFGPSVNANATGSNLYLYFTMTSGTYTSEYSPTVDETITQDTVYTECISQDFSIRQYFANITTIIQTGLNTIPRNEPTQLTTELASRATVWTLRDSTGTNPHNLETGTPVRLVPRPRYDTVTNQYIDVDKRKVRLPNGFDTNEKYYVIAPARTTKPEDYSSVGAFNGSDQTKLMLASSKENAAAGIYIHSAEVEAIDSDIEIDIYQFVLDDKYDLHQYNCVLDTAVNSGIRTDVPHIFDVPFASIPGHKVFFRKNEGGSLPLVGAAYSQDPSVADSNGRVKEDAFFWARYQNEKVFTIHTTKSDAIANVNPITFQPGTYDFAAFADKREAPMRFDPTYQNPGTTPQIYGKWYLQVENHSENSNDPQYEYSILTRLHEGTYSDLSGQDKTNDTWFERIKDEREADERIYRLRYVIPKYLQAVRDPINGFSIKVRKDETRKLLPQKLVLRPVTGSVTKARFFNPVQANEVIGYTKQDFLDNSLNEEVAYDPYKRDIVGGTQYAKVIETQNYVSMTIQSGRYFIDGNSGDELLEIDVFDLGVTNLGLLNETFTTVKITAPQGGNFVADRTQSLDATNRIEWFGNSSGYGYLHAALNVPGTNEWHLIIKGISGKIDYSEFDNIRFSQDAVFADLLADEDFGKSLYIKDLIAKGYPEYYYRQKGASIYTVTPGDIITDDANIQYYVESVTDAGELDDTFYIFDSLEIQRRIYGQQDGIYYLTAIRGNVSPFPTGAGNQGNFKNMKFSQPISKLYPLNYKNDPLWFKQLDVNAIDPPQTYSAADNYTHGLVTVNDFKGSMTREMVGDFITQSVLSNNTYTQVSSVVDNRIKAQKGNATSGSEDRRIPIAGDSTVMSDMRLYVELRRPSIARAGNHTFEYLGFGPGNYSTGLPARQEIVLTPTQDFYAQSKKQDGGLVFYTGLNSNGDLYIGNRKIDAITGEEEFLESAQLVDSDDDNEDVGNLVTTFDTPVTFNENITVNGGDQQDKTSTFNSPVTINVLGRVRDFALNVISNVSPSNGDDGSLDKTQQFLNQDTFGDIVIARNRVAASVFQFNPRGSNGAAQGYKIQNHVVGSEGSNYTPNQSSLYSTGLGTALDPLQAVQYGNAGAPFSGDILLKGNEVGVTGSLGWIYSNFFASIPAANIQNLFMNGSTVITINWGNNLKNKQVGVTSGSQIRISNFSDSGFNGKWQIISNGFNPEATSCQIAILENRGNVANDNPRLWSSEIANNSDVRMEFSNSAWKEVGVLGSETLRTDTNNIGNYKLGVNTVARSEHEAWKTGFVDPLTEPRANLDVVGNAFISGKTIQNYLDHTVYGNRTETAENNALLVGGDSASPDNEATFRIATSNGGRVGINVTNVELDRSLVVDGISRFTDDARFEHDIEVNGDDGAIAEIRTSQTTGTFNLVTDSTFTGVLNIGNDVETLNLLNTTTQGQSLYVGNNSINSNIWIGNTPDFNSNISKVIVGGAYNNNESLSFVQVATKSFKVAGDFQLGTRRDLADTVNLSSTAGTVNFFAGNSNTNILNFATNASTITIAGQGGTTKVRNKLEVDASATFNSNITLCGGYASFQFTAYRGISGSDEINHASGDLGNNLFNQNVDIITVDRKIPTDTEYCELDTAGAGNWGGIPYQNALNAVGGNPQIEPQDLPQLTGNQYYLPINNPPIDADGNPHFKENDYLLIDSPEGIASFLAETDFSTFTPGNDASAYSFIQEFDAGVDISASGPGNGSSGGFATGQNYLHFHTGSSTVYTNPRICTFAAVDGSSYNGGGAISRMEFDIYVGDNTNGGEIPDLDNEALVLRYSLDNGVTWTAIESICPTTLDDNDPTSWPTFIEWINQSANYAKFSVDIPVAAQQAGVQFQLYQNSDTMNQTGNFDNYGITKVTYLTGSSVSITTHVEFLRVISTPRINAGPYYLVVEREPFGTFTGVRNDHPDNTPIYKVNVQFDSTWITQPIDNIGTIETIYLAEFGGNIEQNDYVIISRDNSQTPVEGNPIVYDRGEVFKVDTPIDLVPKKFTISSDCDTGTNVFVIDSVTGDTTIEGDVTINNGLSINGGCETTVRATVTCSINGTYLGIATEFLTGISDTDIANVQIGDVVKFDPQQTYNALIFPATRVVEIRYASGDNTIVLGNRIQVDSLISNVKVKVYRNEEFTITNGKDQSSLYFDTCTSELELGNQSRRLDVSRVYPNVQSPADSTATYSSNLSDIRVYGYWVDPGATNAGGPSATLNANANTGVLSGVYLQLSTLGIGVGQFAVDDLIIVGNTADISGNGLTGNNWEFMKILAVDTTSNTIRCEPGQEGTAERFLSNYPAATTTVLRILKHPESSALVDIETRSRTATGDFVSIVLDQGQIAQQKFDYSSWLRFHDIRGNLSDEVFFINGGLKGKYHSTFMDDEIQVGDVPYRTGDLTLNNNLSLIGGSISIKDSVNKTQILAVDNDDGHADHSGSIYFDAGVIGRGDIKLYSTSCPEDIFSHPCDVTFQINTFGEGTIGTSLTVRGNPVEVPPKTGQLILSNLGPNGANEFVVNQDQSIDSFGINNFYTSTGGRHARYVSSGSEEAAKFLTANVQYFANVNAGDNLVLYLPENPQSGDTVSVIEVGGNLTYDTSLVMRAQGIGTKVQGDSTGTTIGIGGTTNYTAGELIVQTPNAGFTLVYLGGTDSNGTIVSSAVQGWWLKEV